MAVSALTASFTLGPDCADAQEKITFDAPETMGLSMFRGHWDTPIPLAADGATEFWDGVRKDKRQRGAYAVWSKEKRVGKPGALAFDALNRSLLVRFPGAAEKIAQALKNGRGIAKVELILPFKDEELFAPGAPDWPGPDSYSIRTNWGIDDLYLKNRPTWHAVAWALRRPWKADENLGPTFNAAVNGKVFWGKYGAQDEKTDRFPLRFGPAEVSHQKSEAVDVTALLKDAAFGKTLGERLRALGDNGFLVRKLETYDHRYFRGVYEFATATGGRAILINTPRLEVTLAPGTPLSSPLDKGGQRGVELPPAVDVAALPASGKATAMIPPADVIEKWATQSTAKPPWMSQVQFTRVKELMALSGGNDPREPLWTMFVPGHIINKIRDTNRRAGREAFARPVDVYSAWVDQLIARQTRGWSGFETANEYTEYHLAKDILPGPAKDAIFRYWTDWLMPGRVTAPEEQMLNPQWLDGSLVHPMVDQLSKGSNTSAVIEGDSYWLKTGDWRGNKSFFRSGFTYKQSTQNFNTTSSTGAYIFGNVIGAPEAVQDGKVGIDRWLLKGWTWGEGTGQEHFDHYYYTVSLKGLKALQNAAQDDATRLMGDSLITKAMEEALLAWHPNLKRFVAPSSRTSLNYLLGTQEGGNYLMHALSQKGVLTDIPATPSAARSAKLELPGPYPVLGQETPPSLVALMTLQKPWVSSDMTALVDDKPYPWEATHANSGQWRRTFFGRNYGLASSSTQSGRIQAMAQWRRADKEVTSANELGTLDMRLGVNDTNWVNNAAGWIWQPGKQVVAQSKNAWLTVGSPNCWNGGFGDGKTPVSSVQQSIGFFDLRALEPGAKMPWEIYVGGQKIEALPVKIKHGTPIVIRDGVSFIGVVALPSPDLGRDAEVLLEEGKTQKADFAGHKESYRAGLVISSYIVKRDAPLTKENIDWYALDSAFAGFAVQFGDAAEGTFEAFLQKMNGAKVGASFDAATRTVTAQSTIGGQTLRFSTVTASEKKADGSWDGGFGGALDSPTANDALMYPSKSVLLDTPLDVAGWGELSKNGATLKTSNALNNGPRLFLQSSPDKKRFVAWNPQGTPADLQMALPGGVQIRSDGMLGLAKIACDTQSQTLNVDHAFTDGREAGGEGIDNTNASALLLANTPDSLKITLNGQPYTAPLSRITVGNTSWRVLPLSAKPRSAAQMAKLLAAMDKAPAVLRSANLNRMFQHWRVAGLFPATPGAHGPERDLPHLDEKAVYAGERQDGKDAQWKTATEFVKNVSIYGPQHGPVTYFFRIAPEKPTPPGTYYLLATARSATAQEAMAMLRIRFDGMPPVELKLWLNGKAYALPDEKGGRVRVPLQAGENRFLIKIRQAPDTRGSEQPLFTLGDPLFGLPLLPGVEWQAADGSWVTVTPQKESNLS